MHNLSSTEWIEYDITKLFNMRQKDIGRKNSTGKVSLRAAFKVLRRQSKYSLLGDYPLIFCGARTLKKYGVQITARDVLKAMNASNELKGRFRGKSEAVNYML